MKKTKEDILFHWQSKKKWKKILLLASTSIIVLSSCSKPEPYTFPKEGEVVTWKFTPQLVYKARLGQRREHIPDTLCPRCEHEFYNPEYDRFLGQFRIDYVPERFAKLSVAEVEKLPPAWANNGKIEFYLMLNGAKPVDVTDKRFGSYTLDDPNQVKVAIGGCPLELAEKIESAKKNGEPSPYSTKKTFEMALADSLDASTKVSKDGIDCYSYKDSKLKGRQYCFAASENASVSGVRFAVSSDVNDLRILGRSEEYKYGCMEIEWEAHRKNLYEAKKIDAAIWRLLDAWNVSPHQ